MIYELTDIRERVENTSFDKAYVKGDPWKGYEVRNEGNGMVIASTSAGTDAEFIANARKDISILLAEIERLSKETNTRVYIVKRNPAKVDWDEYDSIVVKAKNEKDASKYAKEFQRYFGERDVEVSEVLQNDTTEGVIHESYRAG